jgi:hypothetical protein
VYTTDEFEQALIDSQDSMSLVPETHQTLTYPQGAEVMPMPPLSLLFVDKQHLVDETMNAKHNATKVAKAHTTGGRPKLG